MALDGKGNWSSTTNEVAGAKESSCDGEGTPLWMLGTLRAVLVSSSARPCVDLQLIAAKEAESPTFRQMFPRVVKSFGGRFQLVTGDAGLACRENAQLICDHLKDYLFGLKGNQPTLLAWAQALLATAPILHTTREVASGKLVVRELSRVVFEHGREPADFPGARQLWRVRQTSFKDELSWPSTSATSSPRSLPSTMTRRRRSRWFASTGE
ncbi:MAG: hypothetical protein ACT4TC_19765 [Myxococcaceae bacterium]